MNFPLNSNILESNNMAVSLLPFMFLLHNPFSGFGGWVQEFILFIYFFYSQVFCELCKKLRGNKKWSQLKAGLGRMPSLALVSSDLSFIDFLWSFSLSFSQYFWTELYPHQIPMLKSYASVSENVMASGDGPLKW